MSTARGSKAQPLEGRPNQPTPRIPCGFRRVALLSVRANYILPSCALVHLPSERTVCRREESDAAELRRDEFHQRPLLEEVSTARTAYFVRMISALHAIRAEEPLATRVGREWASGQRPNITYKTVTLCIACVNCMQFNVLAVSANLPVKVTRPAGISERSPTGGHTLAAEAHFSALSGRWAYPGS